MEIDLRAAGRGHVKEVTQGERGKFQRRRLRGPWSGARDARQNARRCPTFAKGWRMWGAARS
jgi:hypothetical protein